MFQGMRNKSSLDLGCGCVPLWPLMSPHHKLGTERDWEHLWVQLPVFQQNQRWWLPFKVRTSTAIQTWFPVLCDFMQLGKLNSTPVSELLWGSRTKNGKPTATNKSRRDRDPEVSSGPRLHSSRDRDPPWTSLSAHCRRELMEAAGSSSVQQPGPAYPALPNTSLSLTWTTAPSLSPVTGITTEARLGGLFWCRLHETKSRDVSQTNEDTKQPARGLLFPNWLSIH